jgi:hypothetical protein
VALRLSLARDLPFRLLQPLWKERQVDVKRENSRSVYFYWFPPVCYLPATVNLLKVPSVVIPHVESDGDVRSTLRRTRAVATEDIVGEHSR